MTVLETLALDIHSRASVQFMFKDIKNAFSIYYRE